MNNTKIGQYIKFRLKEKGITQEKLAEELNISSSAVSQVLSGKNMFDYPNMMLLAKILDEPLDRIMNAGEETVTILEELSKLPLSEYLKKDPDLNKATEIDSKNNSFIEYVLKNKNYSILKYLKDKVHLKNIVRDIRYATIIIENEDKDLFDQVNKNYLTYENDRFGITDIDEGYPLKKFNDLSKNEQEFIKAIISTKNETIRNNYWFINKLSSRSTYRPRIIFYAIENDAIDFVRFIVEIQNSFDSKLPGVDNVRQSRFLDYFKSAVESKSSKCIDYLFDILNDFSLEKLLPNLVSTKDIEFIQTFTKKYKSKGRYNNYHNQKYKSYNTLKDLLSIKEYEILEYLLEFSDQDSLDRLLRDVNEEDVDLIKLLVKNGARFTFFNSESGTYHANEQLSALMKDIVVKTEK